MKLQVSTWRHGGHVGRKPTIQKRVPKFWRKNKWLAESAYHIHISIINKLPLWTFQSQRKSLSTHLLKLIKVFQFVKIECNALIMQIFEPTLFCTCCTCNTRWSAQKQTTSRLLTMRLNPQFEPFQKAVQGRLNFLRPSWKTVQERLLQECQFTRACWLLQVRCKVFVNLLAITSIYVLCPG